MNLVIARIIAEVFYLVHAYMPFGFVVYLFFANKFICEEKIDYEPEWHVGMNQIKYFNNDPRDNEVHDWSGPCSNCWDHARQRRIRRNNRKITQQTGDLEC